DITDPLLRNHQKHTFMSYSYPEEKKGVLTGSEEYLYIVVDDSNLYIEGKYTVGEIEHLDVYDYKRESLRFDQLRIDYGRLLRIIQGERTLGERPIVVGSISPSDTLWQRIRDEGFTVKTYPRNAESHEKRVDMKIGQYINGIFYNKVPSVLALVDGDDKFQPVLQDAVQLGWTVEIYFGILLDEPKPKGPVFQSLGNFYKTLSYGYGAEGNTKATDLAEPQRKWESLSSLAMAFLIGEPTR
ncbi:2425_t:CDS:2, partial [Ambispora gerdemannii]